MSNRVKRVSTAAGIAVLLVALFATFNYVGKSAAQTDPRSIVARSWLRLAAQGFIPGAEIIHKFGTGTVGTSIAPVTLSGFYRTPTAATALEIVSSSGNDTAAGTGVQEIEFVGLDSNWTKVTRQVVPNGTNAVALPVALTRLYRWYATKSGTYATQSASSHNSTLTIRESGGGNTWSIIDSVEGLGRGQSLIGVYTVETGKIGWFLSSSITNDSSKIVNFYLFRRCGTDTVTAPYTAMRVLREYTGITAPFRIVGVTEDGPLVGPCDIGYMAKVSVATAIVTVDIELLIVDN